MRTIKCRILVLTMYPDKRGTKNLFYHRLHRFTTIKIR